MVIRRAATSALVGFGVWLLVTIFGQLIVDPRVGHLRARRRTRPTTRSWASYQTPGFVTRLLPSTLYQEISAVILQPNLTQISTPATIGQLEQAQQQIPGLLSLDQSMLLVWPQVVALVALTVVCFAAAYALFMRQEVRA